MSPDEHAEGHGSHGEDDDRAPAPEPVVRRTRAEERTHRIQWFAALGTAMGGLAAVLTLLFTVVLDGSDESVDPAAFVPPSATTTPGEAGAQEAPGGPGVVASSIDITDSEPDPNGGLALAGHVTLSDGRVLIPTADDPNRSYEPDEVRAYVWAERLDGDSDQPYLSTPGDIQQDGSWEVALRLKRERAPRFYSFNPGLKIAGLGFVGFDGPAVASYGENASASAGSCSAFCELRRALIEDGTEAFDLVGESYQPGG